MGGRAVRALPEVGITPVGQRAYRGGSWQVDQLVRGHGGGSWQVDQLVRGHGGGSWALGSWTSWSEGKGAGSREPGIMGGRAVRALREVGVGPVG
jgi:hypothetical protein